MRPLLGVHKEGRLSVCHGLGLPYVLDPTNSDPSYQRNRLRQLLEEASAAEAAEYYEFEAENAAAGLMTPQVVKDALKLQRLCSSVSRAQQYHSTALLKQSVLYTSKYLDLGPGTVWRGLGAREREEQRLRQQAPQHRLLLHLPRLLLLPHPPA